MIRILLIILVALLLGTGLALGLQYDLEIGRAHV